MFFLSFCKDVLKTESVKTSWNEREVLVNSHCAEYLWFLEHKRWMHFKISVVVFGRGRRNIVFLQYEKTEPQERCQNSRPLSRRRSEPGGSRLSRINIKCTSLLLCVITRNICDIKQ